LVYKQTNRSIQVSTPLGGDALLITGFQGTEQLSHLFSVELRLIASNSTSIDFGQLIGNDMLVRIATTGEGEASQWRYFSGICARFSQGDRNEDFTSYYAELVPKVWLLTRRVQSRIFQQKSVPDILKEVLKGFECDFQLRSQYEHREYCVQYRETDFNFASRLMEEEGIFYFFEHSESGHKMVVADSSVAHSDVLGLTKARYDVTNGGTPNGDHIFEWRKTQELRSSKYTLWDHSFQQPKINLEAKENILDSIQAGTVSHRLKGQPNDPLEIYDFPGGYALRFDGISPSGGEQSERLQKILEDNKRTVKLRMEAEAAQSLVIEGSSGCRNFVAGQKFSLKSHFDADGDYVLLSVTHEASMGSAYRSGAGGGDLRYANVFHCIPFRLPYRPQRRTPKPCIQGVQNALVTGPPGEEIFTDKYGRVKIQFYWDRQGKKDANSSCWLRVGTLWAGKGWGGINIPRIGQEVIVAFVEGNPDEPVIVASVYNRETMPANSLPDKKVVSGLKSNTYKGKGYNELSMDDTAGQEKITIHGQYDMNTTVEHDQTDTVHNNRSITIDGTHTETIKKDTTIKITEGKLVHEVTSKTADYSVKGAVTEKFDATQETTVKNNITIKSAEGEILIEAAKSITLHTGDSKITMAQNGDITLEGVNIKSIGKTLVHCSAPTVEAAGTQTASMGVGRQSMTCDTAKVLVSGAGITATAVGVHEISGAMVKIN
jgi:type VI secretion system secreted protein VgrG